MIKPKGKILHQNLSTEYTDVAQLLSTLKSNAFDGMVEIETADRKGAYFMIGGKTVNAVLGSAINPAGLVGAEAIEELLAVSAQPNAVLNVYQSTPAEIEFAVSTLKSECIHSKLSTDFVRMDRFLQKLASEKHTGYIEVFTKANRTIGVLSLKDGEVVGLMVTPESGDPSFFDAAAVPALLEEVMREGAVFDVYRSLSVPAVKEEAQAPPPKEEPAAPERAPELAPEIEAELKAAAEAVIELELPEPAAGKTVNLTEKQMVEEPEDEAAPLDGRSDLLGGLENVFNKVEKFIDSASQKGAFLRALKRACIERSDAHPFLDPFEGLFDYSSGRIRLDDGVEIEEFAVAVADCFNLTLSLLQKDLPKNFSLPVALKGEIEASFKGYQELIKQSGLQFVVPTSYH
jgi:hypothetical protein